MITSKYKIGKLHAFSLVELTVSTTVLLLLMVSLAQVIGAVANTWREGAARVDNLTQARAVIGLLQRDVQSMVLRSDVAAFVDAKGNPACAFYSQVQGGDGDRRVSLVKYEVDADASDNTSGLARFDYGMNYDQNSDQARTVTLDTTDNLPDLSLASQEEFAPGIIAFGLQFLDGSGALKDRFYFNYKNKADVRNTKTLLVSLAVLDNAGFDLALGQGKLPQLVASFAKPSGNPVPHAKAWSSLLTEGRLPSDLPKPVRTGIRVFESYISIPCP